MRKKSNAKCDESELEHMLNVPHFQTVKFRFHEVNTLLYTFDTCTCTLHIHVHVHYNLHVRVRRTFLPFMLVRTCTTFLYLIQPFPVSLHDCICLCFSVFPVDFPRQKFHRIRAQNQRHFHSLRWRPRRTQPTIPNQLYRPPPHHGIPLQT